MYTDFSRDRRSFVVDGLSRLGDKSSEPSSGRTYGEMLRAFNDFHPSHKIEDAEWQPEKLEEIEEALLVGV